jgi:hypothetical protein
MIRTGSHGANRQCVGWPNALLLGAACVLSGCGGPPENEYSVQVTAVDDEGAPLQGLLVAHQGHELGATDAAGVLLATLRGTEGDVVDLAPRCPSGYVGPKENSRLLLRRLLSLDQGKPAPAQITFACEPSERRLVVVVRTNEAALPIRIVQEEVARTSELGTAHVVRQGPPGTDFKLTLDTEDQPDLRPQSPTRLFRVAERDSFVVWEQSFQRLIAKAPPKRKPKPIPKPPVPYRLGVKQ